MNELQKSADQLKTEQYENSVLVEINTPSPWNSSPEILPSSNEESFLLSDFKSQESGVNTEPIIAEIKKSNPIEIIMLKSEIEELTEKIGTLNRVIKNEKK